MSRQLWSMPVLNEKTAIYLAGLFDGEGAFMLNSTEFRGSVKYNARIRIAMSDQATIEWVAMKLERPIKVHQLSKKAQNAKTMYKVSIEDGESIIFFIEQLLPFLITKRNVALELLAFCKSRLNIMKKPNIERAYSLENIEAYKKMKQINHIGFAQEGGYQN